MNSAATYVSLPNRTVSLSQVEDFVEPNGKISLQREETPSNRYGRPPSSNIDHVLVIALHKRSNCPPQWRVGGVEFCQLVDIKWR